MARWVIGLYAVSCIVATAAFAQENASGDVRPADDNAPSSTPADESAAPAPEPATTPPAAGPATTAPAPVPASIPPAPTPPAPVPAAISPAAGPAAMPPEPAPRGPWRAYQALGGPTWLRFGLEHRLRFENLEHDFRSTATGDSTATSMRTLISAEAQLAPVVIGAELEDSRAYASAETPLNNSIVDSIDILQAYATVRGESLLASGDTGSLTAGRFTMNIGSRRLVSRNGFRNTINSFTGLSAEWASPGHHALRAFAVMPVLRLPTDTTELADNRVELDKENSDAVLSGIFFGSAPLAAGVQLEAYVLGLHERDSADAASNNRRLWTPGVRVLRAPAPGQFDFQVEAMLQFGTSRATTKPTDTTDLTHRAGSAHATCGYRFEAPLTPRVALQYDYASGDRDPNDKRNERFDALFGSRGFDFGPTGLYGAFARSNLNTPQLRVEVVPHPTVNVAASYGLFWLASSRDAWTTSGVRDSTGASGSFVGQKIEGNVRWHLIPKNLVFEVGAATIVRGRFAKDAPNAQDAAPVFAYTAVTATI